MLATGSLVTLIKFIWEWRDRSRRSRLKNPTDLDLPEIPDNQVIFKGILNVDQFLFGRREHINQLRNPVESHPLLFVYGPSGAGKSTLLKVGLCRELYSTGRWLPIYVDLWGSDWAIGPWNILAECVRLALASGLSVEQHKTLAPEGVRRANVFQILKRLQADGPRRPTARFWRTRPC